MIIKLTLAERNNLQALISILKAIGEIKVPRGTRILLETPFMGSTELTANEHESGPTKAAKGAAKK